jgi:predicted NAD-dependent protein-ADP-ribosyltransferase YbiA (DUF1768 family)
METVLRLKIKQHPDLEDALMETGDALIVEDCTNRAGKMGSMYWGAVWREIGVWEGENQLGKLWMKLREEIKTIE